MSFKFGGVDSDSLAGVTATLSEWPSLGGLSLEYVDSEGADGRHYAGHSRTRTEFVFDVIISGPTQSEVGQRRDNFVALLDPSRGPQSLTLETDEAWVWRDVIVSQEIKWGRMAWQRDTGYVLRSEVTLETVADPAAFEVEPQLVTFTGATSFTRNAGNTASFPRMLFAGYSAAGGDAWNIQIGDFELSIAPGIASGLRCSLDWQNFEFYLLDSAGKRVASLVSKMSNFDRPTLRPGETVELSVSRGGVTPAVSFYPNNRRA